MIGFNCFTPNCENETMPSIIIKIEVIEENAEVKTVIEGPAVTLAQPTKPPPVTKGAIRKQVRTFYLFFILTNYISARLLIKRD